MNVQRATMKDARGRVKLIDGKQIDNVMAKTQRQTNNITEDTKYPTKNWG